MATKRLGQLSLVDALVTVPARPGPLDRIGALVRWDRFETLLAPLCDETAPGRPGWPAVVLFKALLLQSLYGLSDRGLEEALGDRLSFRRFLGLGLEAGVPDHTVLNRFRNRLVAAGLADRLFAELDEQLERAGLMLKHGTMLDATLIETTSARPPRGAGGRDPDAAFAKRSGKPGSVYGYKAHVGVDRGSGLIRAQTTTPANVNDTTPADDLIRGDETAVYGDPAYHTQQRAAALKARGIKPRLARRANKHHPRLPPRLDRYNRMIGAHRAGVETTFATLKNRMGLTAIRYVGLAKAAAQVTLAAIAFNLRRWVRLVPA